ncbi:MBL fold metallo-hydrolase [Simkania negevensis]|uniref:MBL fold metallo-hydrolase n=1 Tax=Simkania negevensis TaxID=83561 RepID=A0ABS3AW24_9BACT|nr:MBL fold metallo-hydrolase [Simkania negevensis]
MLIEVFPSGPFSTNAYLIACEETKEAVVVDPSPGSFEAIASFLAQHLLKIKKILLTHSHWDHIGDVAAIVKESGVGVYVHEHDAGNLKEPGSDGLPLFFAIEGVEPTGFFCEGDEIGVGNLKFLVIETPGHTPGGVCFYCDSEDVLISGDTLFKGSIGNLDFPTANAEEMWRSLDRLAKLPPQTKVYPGHGEATTIAEESWLSKAREIFG